MFVHFTALIWGRVCWTLCLMNERDVRGNCRPGKRNAARWSSDGLLWAEPPAPPDSTRSERKRASYHHHDESLLEKLNTGFCCFLCAYLSTLQHVPFVHDLQRVHLLRAPHPSQSHLRVHTSVHVCNRQSWQNRHKPSHLAEGSSADHLQDVEVIPAYSRLLHLSDQRLRWREER